MANQRRKRFREHSGMRWSLYDTLGIGAVVPCKAADLRWFLYRGQDVDRIEPDAGQLQITHVKSGKVRLIAVADENRARILPDVPTAGETLKGFKVANWYGVLGPKGLPPAVREKLWNDLDRIMKQPNIVAQLDQMGLEYPGLSTEQFNSSLKEDRQHWDQVIKELQIQPN